ncbi:MAG: AraC family transcriptional regulator [Colwellia sp.]
MKLIKIKNSTSSQSIMGISLLVKMLNNYQIEPKPLLNEVGICEKLLEDPNAQISFEQEYNFTLLLIKAIADTNLGFKAGQLYRVSAFGHIGLGASASETVNEAIDFFLKYIRLAYTHFNVNFIKENGNAILRFKDIYELGALRQFYIERDFSFAFLSTRDIFPRSVIGHKPKTIHFDFPCPSCVKTYEDLYECPVLFDMPFNEILFDEKYLMLKLPQANALTKQLFEEQCKAQEIAFVGYSGFESIIRDHIINHKEIPNLSVIASLHQTTARTIRRKLSSQGTSFQQIVNEVLCDKSKKLLDDTSLTIEKIAYQLGYSEAASFIHAFKRWTNTTPNSYRKSS